MRKALVLSALVLLAAASESMGDLGQIRGLQLPAGVNFPTSYTECDALNERWSLIAKQVSQEHQSCIDSARPGEQRGQTCSLARCQGLHELKDSFSAGRNAKTWGVQVQSCRRAVANLEERQRREQQAQREAELFRQARRQDEERQLNEALSQYRDQRQHQRWFEARQKADEIKNLIDRFKDGLETIRDAREFGLGRATGRVLGLFGAVDILFSSRPNELAAFIERYPEEFARIDREIEAEIQRNTQFENAYHQLLQQARGPSTPIRAPQPAGMPPPNTPIHEHNSTFRAVIQEMVRRETTASQPAVSTPRERSSVGPAGLIDIMDRCNQTAVDAAACMERELQNK